MNKFIRHLRPYKYVSNDIWDLHNDPAVLKLDWNESTIGPSPHVRRDIITFLKSEKHLQWYAKIQNKKLHSLMSKYCRIGKDYISTFNGSDRALSIITETFLNAFDDVLVFSPTYDHFRVAAQTHGGKVREVVFHDPFAPTVQEVVRACRKSTKMIYIVNPNNPTGALLSLQDIKTIVQKCKNTMIVVDEAYIEFNGKSSSPLITKYKNLIITRTFSKAFGLAGIKLGYILAHPKTLEPIHRVKNFKEINVFAQIAGIAALQDLQHTLRYIKEVQQSRVILVNMFDKLGIPHFGTHGNFILIRLHNPNKVIAELNKKKIFVRDRSNLPQLENMIRITIGDLQSMRRLMHHLKPILERDLKR